MEEKKFTVNNGIENFGPLEFQVILDMVAGDQLKATDQLFLEETNQWILICQHPEFAKNFKAKQIPKPTEELTEAATVVAPVAAAPMINDTVVIPPEPMSTEMDWFILKGESRQGPFGFTDVIKMLQQKVLFEYDYVWRQGMESWTRVAQLPDFSPDRIRAVMKTKEAKSEEVFFRRKFARLKYNCSIVAHDNKNFWSGHTTELGEGGAGIVIENAMIMPGQSVYLHFKPGESTKSFNVLCEVVSKKYLKNIKDRNAPMVYGVKFINIPKSEKDIIKSMSSEAA